jgi:hypothetical protein
MANTILGTDHALAVKLWEAKTYMEALQESAFGTLFGSGAVTLPTEFKTRGFTGDEITVAHVNQLTGGPIMGAKRRAEMKRPLTRATSQ